MRMVNNMFKVSVHAFKIYGNQKADESAAICVTMSLVGQCVIGRGLHLLGGYRLHYRLHKLNMADLAIATFYGLLPIQVLL